jgi:deoxyribodipyrimidine photolyase
VALWWIRHADLRLDDNPPLRTAVASRDHLLLPVYVHCPDEEGDYGPPPGSAVAVWLENALLALEKSLKERWVEKGRPGQ